jgi:hypothetical protein
MLNVHRTDANICNSKISQTNRLESCGKNAAEKKCLCVFLTLVILKLYIFVGSTCRRSYLQVTTFGRSYAMQFHVESGAIFDEDETFGRTRRGYSRRIGAVFFLHWCGARLGRLVAVAAPSASHFACAYPK